MTRRSTPVGRKSILSMINVDAPQPPHRRPGGHPARCAARHRLRLREPRPSPPQRGRRRSHLVVRSRRGRRPGPTGPTPGTHRAGRVGRRRPGVRTDQHHRRPPALPGPRRRRPRGARPVRGRGRVAVDGLAPRGGPTGLARARGLAGRRRGGHGHPARHRPHRRSTRRRGGRGRRRRRVARRPAPRHRAAQGPHDDHRLRPNAIGGGVGRCRPQRSTGGHGAVAPPLAAAPHVGRD